MAWHGIPTTMTPTSNQILGQLQLRSDAFASNGTINLVYELFNNYDLSKISYP